ncbi:MAG: STAS domain-containing protein [Candidatus Kariarchaeaceae archaeon]|jgi:anti-anti-sigma factor
MNVSVTETSNATIVKVEIEQMLGYSGTEFQEAVMNSIKSENKCTIVDLSKVTFISSWGLGMLMYGLTTSQNNGKEFKIACACDKIRTSFSNTKLDTVFKLYDSVDEAADEV